MCPLICQTAEEILNRSISRWRKEIVNIILTSAPLLFSGFLQSAVGNLRIFSFAESDTRVNLEPQVFRVA